MSIACPDCGTVQDFPAPAFGTTAVCPVCAHKLERTSGRSVVAALACSVATFVLLLPANALPLMSVNVIGIHLHSRMISSVSALWHSQWVLIALMVAAFVIVLPFVRFGLLSAVLTCVRVGWRPGWLGRAFRWTHYLDQWAMPDVYLIGCFVGYSRVSAKLPVTINWGGFCFMGAALLCMLTRATLDRRKVWRAIAPEPHELDPDVDAISCTVCDVALPVDAEGKRCPRCGQRLHTRKPAALTRTVALTVAGLAFYLPANFYPMDNSIQLGERVPYRIIDGILKLVHVGLWPLAVLVFITSIAIPALKLLAMVWFVASVRYKSSRHLVLKTRLYRVIDELGRWSNVDVFIIAVFVPMIQFGELASTHPAKGMVAFMLVVILTMLASQAFDPRLMWDAKRVKKP